jgi:hypothetical protein
VFLLLKQFSFELQTEAEVFLMMLIKIIGDDVETGAGGHPGDHAPSHGKRPQWVRVLAMEIMRGYVFIAHLDSANLVTFPNT